MALTLMKLFIFCMLFTSAVQVYGIEPDGKTNYYEQALHQFNQKNYEATYIHLKKTLENNANHIPSKVLLGRLYLAQNYYDEAQVELTEALTLGGDIEFIISPLGKSLLAERQYQTVIELAKKYKLSSVAKVKWYILSAAAYNGLKQPKREQEFYYKVLKLAPNNVEVINSVVKYNLQNKQLVNSQELLKTSLMLDDKNPQTWQLQGLIHKYQKNKSLALTAFSKALDIDPEFTDASRSLATLYFESGDKKNALLTINHVLKQSPDDSRANLLKAHLLLQENQSELAKQVLNELDNRLSMVTEQSLFENDWIFFIKGTSAFLLENYEVAIKEMTQYLANNKDNFHAVAIIVNSYLKLNLNTFAKDLLDKYRPQASKNAKYAVMLCDLYIEHNQHYRCEELLDDVPRDYLESIDFYLLKARLAYNQNELDKAITIVKEASVKQTSTRYDSYLVNLYLANDQDKDAALLIANLLLKHPENSLLLNTLAATFLKLGKPEAAFGITQQILTQSPNLYSAKYHQTLALLALKKPQQAKILATELLRLQPGNNKSLMLLARIEAALGNANNAIHSLSKLLDADRYNLAANHFLIDLLRLTGQYEQALAQLEKLTQQYRLDTSIIQQKAEIYILLGEKKLAVAQLKILFGFWRDNESSLLSLSKLQIRARDFSGARKTIDRTKELSPKSSKVQYADTKLALYESNFKTADQQLAKLNKSHKQNSQIKTLAGDVAIAKQQLEQGQLLYLQAFKLDTNNSMALVKSYNLAIKGFQPDLFEQYLIQALNKQENNFYFRNLLADYFLITHRYPEAKQHYLRIVNNASLPNKASVLNNLAFAIMHDDLDAALRFAQQANDLKPNSAQILDTLGWIMANNREYDSAVVSLRQAQSINASDPEIRYHLGFALHKLGRIDDAISELEYAVNTPNPFANKLAAKELLAQLKQNMNNHTTMKAGEG